MWHHHSKTQSVDSNNIIEPYPICHSVAWEAPRRQCGVSQEYSVFSQWASCCVYVWGRAGITTLLTTHGLLESPCHTQVTETQDWGKIREKANVPPCPTVPKPPLGFLASDPPYLHILVFESKPAEVNHGSLEL